MTEKGGYLFSVICNSGSILDVFWVSLKYRSYYI